jgi:hypothetical protein
MQVCAIPDGDRMGEPFILTDEQFRTYLHHYRIDPWASRFTHFRGTQLTRPQKWGKGPFAASWVCGEAHPESPVLFDGWDADGQPVGRPWATPHIQITAVSEDQTDNVFRALLPMIRLGALAADIPDTGLTRINFRPAGSSSRSRPLRCPVSASVSRRSCRTRPNRGSGRTAGTSSLTTSAAASRAWADGSCRPRTRGTPPRTR